MPLIKSGSKKAISTNIREMIHAGHPRNQAIAAALNTARRYRKKYADGGDVDDTGGADLPVAKKVKVTPRWPQIPASENIDDRRNNPTEGDLVDQAADIAAYRVKAGVIGWRKRTAAAGLGKSKTAKNKYAPGGEVDEGESWNPETDFQPTERVSPLGAGMPLTGPRGLSTVYDQFRPRPQVEPPVKGHDELRPLPPPTARESMARFIAGDEGGEKGYYRQQLAKGLLGTTGIGETSMANLSTATPLGMLFGMQEAKTPEEAGTNLVGGPAPGQFAGPAAKGILKGLTRAAEESAIHAVPNPHPLGSVEHSNFAMEQVDKLLNPPKGEGKTGPSSEELDAALEQLAQSLGLAKNKPSAPVTPLQQAQQDQILAHGSHQSLADDMFADLNAGVKASKIAQHLVGIAESNPQLALMAKEALPKEAKSDLNKALWAYGQKSKNKDIQEIVDNLFPSKVAAKKAKSQSVPESHIVHEEGPDLDIGVSQERVPPHPGPEPGLEPVERGQTQGVSPDEIEEYLTNQNKHLEGPIWKPTKGMMDELYDRHFSPEPQRIVLPKDKDILAKEWGLTQSGYHATTTPTLFEEFKLPEHIKTVWGEWKDPEIGIHFGTKSAAHDRIGIHGEDPYFMEQEVDPKTSHLIPAPRVFPAVFKADKSLQLPDLGKWGPTEMAEGLIEETMGEFTAREVNAAMSNNLSGRERQIKQIRELRKLIESKGYDSIKYINRHEDQGSMSYITWHPTEIRAPTAAFKNKDTAHLLGSFTGAAIMGYPLYKYSQSGGDQMNRGGKTHMAYGGFNPYKWVPRPSNREGIGAPHAGMIHSPIPGRTDKIGMNVRGGSYVLPADVVSGMGQGNSMAGASALNKLFGQGPYGDKMRGFGTPKVNFGHPMRMASMRMPRIAKAGGVEAGGDHVPIVAAGGEYVIPPEVVKRIGGGDMKHGHEILDHLVLHIRKKTIHEMKHLKGPKK